MTEPTGGANVDEGELGRFEELAARWWDPEGEFRPLHDLNPVRLQFIDERAPLRHRTVLDVGCGGGLLTEAMARRGARVTGIDAGKTALQVARLHMLESDADFEPGIDFHIDYYRTTAEALAEQEPAGFDTVTCLELLEHVPDPGTLVRACARLVKPGGDVFFSTINRTPRAYAVAVLGAEYLLRLLPRGTHDYAKLVRPSELAGWARSAGLELRELAGISYDPWRRVCRLHASVSVNYLAWLSPAPNAPGG